MENYNRKSAIDYAKKWAYKRNPKYYNFDNIGGDCTSFISQCLFAGYNEMNYKKYNGWYYNSINDRAPAWSGVEFLYNFLVSNKESGPKADAVSKDLCTIGDIVQLKFNNINFGHSLIIVDKKVDDIFVACHTEDAYYKNLKMYNYNGIRFLHCK